MKDLNDAGLAQRYATLSDIYRDVQDIEQEAMVEATKAEKKLNAARSMISLLQENMRQIRDEQARRAES